MLNSVANTYIKNGECRVGVHAMFRNKNSKKMNFTSLARLIPLVTSILLVSLAGIPPAHAVVRHLEFNTDYIYYQGHVVGALSVGVHWDDYSIPTGVPRMEMGCSVALGLPWGGYRKYIPKLDTVELMASVVYIWVDKNRNGIFDGNDEEIGPSGLVKFIHIEDGTHGSSDYLWELVDFIYSVAQYLTEGFLPVPFKLLFRSNLADRFDFMYTCVGAQRMSSLYGRIDYHGWEEGNHHIILQLDWIAYFSVYYTGHVEGPPSTLARMTFITPKGGPVWWGGIHAWTYIETIIDIEY